MSASIGMKGWLSLVIYLANRKGTVSNKDNSWKVKKWLAVAEREQHTLQR